MIHSEKPVAGERVSMENQQKRDFISIGDVSRKELDSILRLARILKRKRSSHIYRQAPARHM